jgi:hypothetical protein
VQKLVRIGLIGLLSCSGAAIAAVAVPHALAPASGGMWEVSRSANGHNPTKICVANPTLLAQFEHRQRSCTRKVLSDHGTETLISYKCPAGGFGQSKITLITPRSLKIDTQGISGNLPFHYQLYARRVGDCPAR